jgi:hypothetical protein
MKMINSGNSKPNEEMGFFNLSSSEITGENREIECQIEKKLKKYELTINRLENICRVTNSKVRPFILIPISIKAHLKLFF